MDDTSTNFTLKHGEVIEIEGKDVKRIRMFNDIVWEKRIKTRITLSASPMIAFYNKEYTLTALVEKYIRQDSGEYAWTIMNNASIDLYDITSTEQKLETVQTNNFGIARYKGILKSCDTEKKTYKAVYNKTDMYEMSEATIDVDISPNITSIHVFKNDTINANNIIEDDVFPVTLGQYVIMQLTDANGDPIPGETVTITINTVPYTRKTKEDGTARVNINSLPAGVYEIEYRYAGKTCYTSSYVKQKYSVQPLTFADLTDTNPISVIGISESDKDNVHQRWEKQNNKQYYCYKFVDEHGTNNTINIVGYPHYRPHPLRINFRLPSDIKTLHRIELSFHTFMGAAVSADGDRAHFIMHHPDINLYINGFNYDTYEDSDDCHLVGNSYVSDDVKIWNFRVGKEVFSIGIEFDYPHSVSNVEGFLAVEGIQFKIGYVSKNN